MSIRRMMLFTLGAKIKNLIDAFKTRVFANFGIFEAESCLEAQLTELDNDNLLNSASLIVTPNGYKENLLYSVVPNNTIGDMSVTRATTATRVNADGLIEFVPYNLFQRSEEFENTALWNRQNIVSISTNIATAPNGTLTADKIIPDTTLNQHRIFQQFNFSGQGVLSVYAKADGYNFLSLAITGGVNGQSIYFNLSNGTISGTASGFTPSIESVGNGWYRCSIYNATLGQGINLSYWIIARESATTNNYTGNGTSGILLWGAQLVQGTAPKDYFQTTNRQNVPRIDYSNGSCPSILVEPQRTNLVFPSQTLTTQTRTVTAVAHTLSFYGTGSITLSGVAIGVLNGTGVNNRVTLTFTPTAGSLILTVIGSVTLAQLEAGTNATSYIPTVASAVTRNADVITNTNASTLINSVEGCFFVEASSLINGGSFRLFSLSDGTSNNRITIGWSTVTNTLLAFMNLGGTIRVNNNITPFNQTSNNKVLFKWGGGNFKVFINGVNRLSLTSVTMPTANLFTKLGFDLGSSSSFFEGNVKSVLVFPTQLTDTECINLTTL